MDSLRSAHVIKASGEQVPFAPEKLLHSLRRAGATKVQAEEVLAGLRSRIYSGITTREIYRIAQRLLKKQAVHVAARYHLKRGIMELGPSGYPFEKFIAAVMHAQHFEVQTGVIVPGVCVPHEVDVLAQRERQVCFVECKYHNRQGILCDVKVPLYIHARFNDLRSHTEKSANHQRSYEGWLVTNTRFSKDALTYGTCAGLHMQSWDYPSGNSLREQIDRLGLYPLTCLTTLTRQEKQWLLEKQLVLASGLVENAELLSKAGVGVERRDQVLREIRQLCNLKTSENKSDKP